MLKIADFGISQKLEQPFMGTQTVDQKDGKRCGTFPFMAPEVLSGEKVATRASDVWSFACCIIEMATGVPPWSALMKTAFNLEVALLTQVFILI